MKVINKLKSFFSDLKIRYKLIATYFPITVIILISIGFFSYNISVNIIREQSLMIVTQSQEQYKSSIEKNLENSENFIKNIMYNSVFLDFMSGSYEKNVYNIKNVFDFQKTISMWLSVFQTSANLALVRDDNSLDEIIPNNFHNILSESYQSDLLKSGSSGGYQIYNMNRIENRQWYINLDKSSKSFVWEQIDDDKKYNNITLIRQITDYNNFNKEVGLVSLTIRIDDIFGNSMSNSKDEKFFNMTFDNEGNIIFIDNNKKQFYQKNQKVIDAYLNSSNSRILNLEDKNMAVLKTNININGWKLLSIVPMDDLTKKTADIGKMVLIFIIVALVILFVVTYKLSNMFSARIVKVCEYMQNFQEGDYQKKMRTIHKDELGYLAQTFNEMSEKTEQLISEVYLANIDKKEAQLKALQSQINPHFLYNSLSSINRLAEKGHADKINTMVNALVKFYRMTLNKGRDIIPISDEIEQVKSYIDIFKIRMNETFNVFYDIDESVKYYYTVKVILQPFVENVLEHGIYDREGPINIILSAKEIEGKIIFKIIDDGIGINSKDMDRLINQDTNSNIGYGIKNVDDRIKLNYGSEYGVNVFSRLGIGTVVTITIPKCDKGITADI